MTAEKSFDAQETSVNDTIFGHRGGKVLRAGWTEATGVGGAKEGSAKEVEGWGEVALIEFYYHDRVLRRSERI